MSIPADPTDYLRGRTVLIMGAGRSGTTILSQVVGSMKPVIYVFEPVLLRLMLRFVAAKDIKLALRSVFFEDYLLPRVQGRRLDCDPDDKSFYGNFEHFLVYLINISNLL